MGTRSMIKAALTASVKGIDYSKNNDGTIGLFLCPPQNSYVEALILNVMVFGGGVLLGSYWGQIRS